PCQSSNGPQIPDLFPAKVRHSVLPIWCESHEPFLGQTRSSRMVENERHRTAPVPYGSRPKDIRLASVPFRLRKCLASHPSIARTAKSTLLPRLTPPTRTIAVI